MSCIKVKFVSTYPPENCGIATYSSYYVEAIRKLAEVTVERLEPGRRNPLYFMRLGRRARKDADVIHVQYELSFYGNRGMYTPLFYLCARLFGGPALATTIHEFLDAKKTYRGKLRYYPMFLYYWLVYRFIALGSDAVLVHTEGMKERLSQYGRTDSVHILPHASFIRPVFLPQEECKTKLGLGGKRIITIFGFINSTKGHDLAIEAVSKMPEDVVLYIVGDGRLPEDLAYAEGLKEKARALGLDGRVVFHGYLKDEDVASVMCASDLLLLPYRHVTQSGAINYPLAYGKPVLASNIEGFEEVKKAYGCIDTFETRNAEDLRAHAMKILDDPSLAEALKSKCAAYTSAVDIETIAAKTFDIYKKIVGS